MPKGIPINGVNRGWYKKGQRSSPETEFKKGCTEEKCIQWKGDKVGYFALHQWVNKKLGKPGKCEKCGKDGLKRKQIHWANISGNYKRDINDWIRLCSRCHYFFDKRNKLEIEDVFVIKLLRKMGVSQREVSNIYSVSRTLISAIDTGRTWNNVV